MPNTLKRCYRIILIVQVHCVYMALKKSYQQDTQPDSFVQAAQMILRQ